MMKKIVAALLVFSLIFMFAACGGNDSETTTITATDSGETTADVPVIADDTTVLSNSETSSEVISSLADGSTSVLVSESETGTEATTEAVTVVAPIGNNVAQIVAFYNKSANDTKAYSGKYTIKRTQGTIATLDDISIGALRGTVEGVLPNDYPTVKTKTYTNGKASDGESISKMLPPDKQSYMSKLTAAGVKTASCKAAGNGYDVTLVLVQEKGDDINYKPKHHGSCMDTLNITAEDLAPLTLNNAEITYLGATVKAHVNANGLIESVTFAEPCTIKGSLALKSFNLIKVVVNGTWKQEFVITY